MKVQITGITSNQLNILRKRNPLYSAARGIYDGLKSSGYEVTNSSEDEDADVLYYGLYALNSFVSGGFLKTASILANAIKKGKRIVYFVDDWHIDGIGKSLFAGASNVDGYFRFGAKLLGRAPTQQEIDDVTTSLNHIMFSKAPMIMHTLPWLLNEEDIRMSLSQALLMHDSRVRLYDPTPFIDWNVGEVNTENKQRAWVLTSRYDFRKQIGKIMHSEWPIRIFGCKKVEDSTIVPNEVDLVRAAYAVNWGTISHPYPEKLQGQWRNRYMFSSIAKSVVAAFGKETRNMKTFIDAHDIEAMDNTQLKELAYAQTSEMNSHIDLERAFNFLKSTTEGA